MPLVLLADAACVRTFDCNGELIATLQPDAGYALQLAARGGDGAQGGCAYSDAARASLLCVQTAPAPAQAEAEAGEEKETAGEAADSAPAPSTLLARYSPSLVLLAIYPAMAAHLGPEPSNSQLRQALALTLTLTE